MAERCPGQVQIRREIAVERLAVPDPQVVGGEESGFEGNRAYDDLRGLAPDDLRTALRRERLWIQRLRRAMDLDAAAAALEEERFESFDDDGLWGLDVGVGSATVALSVLGCTPFYSCNGGLLGGFHVGSHPVIAFFLPAIAADQVLALAEMADVGLVLDAAGRARLYAASLEPLVRFAELALTAVQPEGAS